MSQFNDTGFLTATAGAAIEIHRRVKLSGDRTVIKAGAENDIGTVRAAVVSGDLVGVIVPTKPGTVKMVASGVIAVNATVEAAADGKVATLAVGIKLGIVLEAAAADGDVIEVLRTALPL